VIRQLVAAIAMGAVLLVLVTLIENAVVALVAGVLLGGAVYLGVLVLLRSPDVAELRSQLGRSSASPDPEGVP
jgi:hypothetical protein